MAEVLKELTLKVLKPLMKNGLLISKLIHHISSLS